MENKLGQEPAFAQPLANDNHGSIYSSSDKSYIDAGMSKRFYAACVAMQGIISGYYANPKDIYLDGNKITKENIIESSYKMADELLKQEYE